VHEELIRLINMVKRSGYNRYLDKNPVLILKGDGNKI
jgi:hypothetical protein